MKHRGLALAGALVVIAAIVLFFVFYSGKRGEGIYTAKNYTGLYDKPTTSPDFQLIVTARAGERLEVTHVSKSGWATVEYPGQGTLYANFFSLAPEQVSVPVKAGNFYDGNASLLIWVQVLLWGMFLIAGGLLLCIGMGKEKTAFVVAVLLVAAEMAYAIVYLTLIAPADVLVSTPFDSTLAVVSGFLLNMGGLVLLGFAHAKLIRLTWTEIHAAGQSVPAKLLGWSLLVFILLFTLYIAVQLLVMAIIVVVVVLSLIAAVWVISFILDYENSHVTLTNDGFGGWRDSGGNDYYVNEAAGTARKKKFFDL